MHAVGYLHPHFPPQSALLFNSCTSWSGLSCLHRGHLLQLKYQFVFFKFGGTTFFKRNLCIATIFVNLVMNITLLLRQGEAVAS